MIYDIFESEQEITIPPFFGNNTVMVPSEKIITLDVDLQPVRIPGSSTKPTAEEVRQSASLILDASKILGRGVPIYRPYDLLLRSTFELLVLVDPLNKIE